MLSPIPRPKVEDSNLTRWFDGFVASYSKVLALLAPYDSPPEWQTLTLKAGWTGLSNVYDRLQAKLLPDGRTVMLRGAMIGPAAISEISTVPAYMRPKKNKILHAGGAAGYCRVDVRPDGSIALVVGTAVGYLSVDGLSYEID